MEVQNKATAVNTSRGWTVKKKHIYLRTVLKYIFHVSVFSWKLYSTTFKKRYCTCIDSTTLLKSFPLLKSAGECFFTSLLITGEKVMTIN